MTKNFDNGNLDSIIDEILDKVDPLDSKKVEDRLLLAARIGDLIAEKGLSKKQFAGLMGQEPSVVSKWLSGTHNFTQDTLSAISFRLNVPMAEFYREKQEPIVFRSSFGVAGHIAPPVQHFGGNASVLVYYPDNYQVQYPGLATTYDPKEWLVTGSLIPQCTDIQNSISLRTEVRRGKQEHPEMKKYQKA
ncbi:hypothetical protein GCM10027037_00350 [Mucilaginibacter koreensis]